jgi:hypothetical protein
MEMFEASAHRLSVPTSHPLIAGWRRLSRVGAILAVTATGAWLLAHLVSLFGSLGAADDALAATRIAVLVLVGGLGFTGLLLFEALAGRRDVSDGDLDRPEPSPHLSIR